jgi:predicted DsbA family dithiol-disulfide isomerase
MMMSLMSKLSMITIAATLALSAGGFDLDAFVRKHVVSNPRVKINRIELVAKKPVPDAKSWTAYMIVMDLTYRGKSIKAPETVFVNEADNLATMDLIRIDGKSLRRVIKPDMPESYYDDAHLLYGNKNAPHKLVIFSDPDCPFCRQDVPKTIEEVKKHPDKIALYYYHMPLLKLHPVSDVLTRIMEVLQKQGRIDDALKMYKLKINYRETNATKILAEVKKQFGLEIDEAAINKPEIKEAVQSDVDKGTRMMVNGTPTYYYDGRYDNSRIQYKAAILGH